MSPEVFAARARDLAELPPLDRVAAFEALGREALLQAGFGDGLTVMAGALASVVKLPSRPLMRYLGSKWRLAPWVVSHFPVHEIYVEVFGGAAGVMLQKPRVRTEVWADVDGGLVNLFRVLRDEQLSAELVRAVALTPYARAEYRDAHQVATGAVERARQTLVRSHMGHGSRGTRIDRQSGFRSDGTTGKTRVAGEWAEFPQHLCAIIDRLRGVSIEDRPFEQTMEYWNAPGVLLYLDPPYVPATRSQKARQAEGYHTYAHELTVEDHERVLDRARASRSMVVISGYGNDLYDSRLKGWTRRTTRARAHRNSERTEVIWLNDLAAQRLATGESCGPLFGAAA